MGTGFTTKQVQALRERDGNVCLWLGYDTGRLVPNHRASRGMGGSRRLNTLENAVLIDSLVNGRLESDAELARMASARGIKIPRWADPAAVPIFDQHLWQWFVLEGDTRRRVDGATAIEMMQDVYGDKWAGWSVDWRN